MHVHPWMLLHGIIRTCSELWPGLLDFCSSDLSFLGYPCLILPYSLTHTPIEELSPTITALWICLLPPHVCAEASEFPDYTLVNNNMSIAAFGFK